MPAAPRHPSLYVGSHGAPLPTTAAPPPPPAPPPVPPAPPVPRRCPYDESLEWLTGEKRPREDAALGAALLDTALLLDEIEPRPRKRPRPSA